MKPLVYLLFLGLLLLKNATSFVSCPFGYIESNGKCTDEIECENENPICGDNAKCINTKGSYYCQCLKGYQSDSVHFTQEQGGPCKDINECLQREFKCGLNTKCNNIIGSYECMCAEGFRLDNGQNTFDASQNVTCNDIDECTTNRSICGDNAECTNTNGSFFCTCHSGFVSSNRQEKFNSSQVKCNELTCNRLHTEGISEEVHSKELKEFVTELSSTCKRKGVTAEDLLEIVFGALDQFLTNPSLTDPKIITTLFEVVENTQALAGLLAKSSISRSSTHTQVEMLVHRNLTAPHGPISLSTEDVNFSSHWDTAVGSSYVGFASVSLFEYKSLQSHHINRTLYNMFKNKYNLNSKVVTISVTNPNTNKLNKPITVNFSNLEALKETDNYSINCVFWNSTLDGGMWSTEGCKLKAFSTKNTVCECSHLSSFAVLMALYEVDVYELQLITWIGLSLSLICLLICILTFWLIRSIQSTRTAIHLHLCISLFIADFIFLLGISQTSNQVGCAVVAGLLHFFFLAAFCWMCLEGVQLFRMVVLVFNTTLNYGYLMAAGYGIPALIVIISASINHKGYGTKRYCWLNVEDGFIWSFFGPVCIIIVVNAVFFLITVTKLAEKFNSLNPDISNLRKIRTFTITAIAQLCVLGTMWIFGCFQFDEKTLVMSYIFTILNSLQGVLVFIMHCLLSKQVRDEYIRFLTCLTMQQKSSYTEFSTNQSSKSQVSKSIQNTGESRI